MKKYTFIAFSTMLLLSCQNQSQNKKKLTTKHKSMVKENIYQFKVVDLSGNVFDFTLLKEKKVMIVNTASKCGLTPQYEGLEAIYKQYKDDNFVAFQQIISLHKNRELIKKLLLLSIELWVTFPMMEKVSVKVQISALFTSS
jgi:glutathione peroxidase